MLAFAGEPWIYSRVQFDTDSDVPLLVVLLLLSDSVAQNGGTEVPLTLRWHRSRTAR